MDVESTSCIELRTRLQKFSNTWDEFDRIQHEIEAIENEENMEEAHNRERNTFENKFFAITSDLEALIEDKSQAHMVMENSHQVREVSANLQEANVLKDSLKLPRVNLPTFSGKYEEWISFRNIFTSMIDQNVALPKVQKMQYLVSSLKGEAYDIVSSLEASSENYKEAWKMLVDRYDDPAIIIAKHVRALFELPVMTKDNYLALRKLVDTVLKNTRALKALKRPTEHWDDLLIHIVTSRLDHTTCREWETTIQKGIILSFEQLITFLSQRCRALEASTRSQKMASSSTINEKNRNTMTHVATTKAACVYCQKDDHLIYKCKDFLALSTDKRFKEVKSRKLCLNCLKAFPLHQAKQCSLGSCRKCDRKHNTLLHLERQTDQSHEANKTHTDDNKENIATTSINHSAINYHQQVLLATALVNVSDNSGQACTVRALLDNGSQSCFITSECSKRLQLRQYPARIPVYGFGEHSTRTHSFAKISLQSKVSSYKIDLNCLIVDKITQALPVNKLNLENLQILKGIKLADPQFNQTSNIDLLIGAEVFFDLMCIGKIKLSKDQPTWQKTLLGWIVSGSINNTRLTKATICNLVTNEELNQNIARFWQIENCDRINTRNPEERICEAHFSRTHTRNEDGRFIVSLPTKPELIQRLGESKGIALQRLQSLERRFKRNPQVKKEYAEFIHEYIQLGHMRELQHTVDDNVKHCYLPHHCVIKDSSTTRLRVVFDASSKTSSGISLNDTLLTGPVLQQDIFSILARFRTFKYAITGDIEKMYRQVLIDSNQTSLQRILWRDDSRDNIKVYELCTLAYGTASASYLATKVIQRLAEIEGNQYPQGASAIQRDFYVDDFISGANSKEEARELRNQATTILQKGGFKLRKWASNCKDLLNDMPSESSKNQLLQLDKDGASKTLGINWNPTKDIF